MKICCVHVHICWSVHSSSDLPLSDFVFLVLSFVLILPDFQNIWPVVG